MGADLDQQRGKAGQRGEDRAGQRGGPVPVRPTVRALIYAERFGPQRRVNGISLLLAHNFSQRFQGIRMVLPGSSPAAAWSWTAGRSASGRR